MAGAIPDNPFTGHIPEPIADIGALTVVAKAMKQNLEILTGDRGNRPFNRAVLFSDLVSYGLVNPAVFTLSTSSGLGASPIGPAGGDLAGTYPNPTVGQINGVALGTTTATAGNLLIGSGTQWVTRVITGDWTITSAGATTVAKINGVALGSTTATSGNLLIGSGTQWVTNAMSGDVTIGSTGITTIGANKVTHAMLAAQGAATLLGNATGGSATPGDITLGSNLSFAGSVLNAASGTVLQGYLGGLTLSNDGGTPNTILDIAAGMCTSSDNTTLMTLSAFTKTTGAWALGTGNGGLDTGSVANSTWYHVYVIERTDTFVVDILFSVSASAPTMPTNYTKMRRVGSFKTDGSAHIIKFNQNGDEFLWLVPVNDYSVSTLSTTAQTPTLISVPLGVKVTALISGDINNAGSAGVLINAIDQTSVAGGALTTNFTALNPTGAAASYGQMAIRTDTAQSVRAVSTVSNTTLNIWTNGWLDTRGRNA